MQAGSVNLKFLGDIQDLQNKMRQVPGIVGNAMGQVGNAVSGATGILGKFTAALGVGALAAWVRASINSLDALDEMSGRIGISVKELSSLQLAYKQAGMGPEQMGTSLARLSKEIADGSKELAALGINTKNADGTLRSTTSVLRDLAGKFSEMDEGAERTALAMAIFGKAAGPEMVGLLKGGKDGIDEMIATAKKLGLVVEDDVAKKAGDFNDTLELIGLGVTGVGQGIAAQLLPTLQGLAGQFLKSMTEGDRLAKTSQFLGTMLKGLYIVALGLVEAFSSVGKWVGAVAAAAVAAATGNFSQAGTIMKDVAVDTWGAWKNTLGEMDGVLNANGDAAVAAAAKNVKAHQTIQDSIKAREAAAAANAAAEKKEQEAYDSLISSISEKIATVRAEIAGSDKLTEAQKLTIKLNEQQSDSLKKLTPAHEAAIRAKIAELGVEEETRRSIAENLKQLEAARTQRMKDIADMESVVSGLAAQNQQLREEIELIGLTEEQQLRVIQGRNLTTIATKEATLAEMERAGIANENMSREAIALRMQIAELRERNELLGVKHDRTVIAEAAQQAADEWSKFNGDIRQGLTDSLYRGFEAGKGFFRAFWDGIKNTLKTTVLKFAVEGVMKGITGGSSGAGGAAGGGGLGGLLNMGQNIYSAFTGGGMASLGGMIGSLGSAIGSQVVSQFGLGMVAPALSEAAIAAGAMGPAATGLAGSLGSFVAAAAPWAAAAMAIYSIASSLDHSGTPHIGSMAQYSEAGGLSNSQTHGAYGMGFGGVDYSESTATMVAGVSRTVVGILDSVSQAFGGRGGFTVSTGFADDSSEDGAWGGLLIEQFGQALVNWDTDRSSRWAPREFADGEAGQREYLAALAQDVTGVLREMDLPGWAQDALTALGDSPSLESLAKAIDQINATKAALDVMGKNLVGFANYSDEAASALIKASGGISNLATNAATFYDLYYSEDEKHANSVRDVTAALAAVNIALPTSEAMYRQLVEQYTAMGTAGASTLAVLLGMAGAFHEISPAASEFAATVEQLMAEMRNPVRTNEDIARGTIGLEDELFQLMNRGNIAALRERELAGLSATEVALQRRIWAIQDEADAAAAAAAVQSERQGIERDILNLTGDTAALRALELAGLDPANRALKEHYYALLDEQHAAEAAAAAIAAAANEHQSLQGRLWQIQGNSEAIRQAQLGRLLDDESRRLQQEIWAAEDVAAAQTAAQQAAQAAASASQQYAQDQLNAAKQVRDAWQGAINSVVDEIKRINGVMVGDGEMGYAASQAQFAIALAQANAGDQDAFKSLPGLSKAMLDLAEGNTSTMAELRLIQAQTAARLESASAGAARKYGLQVPSFDVGTDFVPHDMLAMVHRGERITPAAFNPVAGEGGTASEQTRAVATRLERVEGALVAIAGHTSDGTAILRRAEQMGWQVRNVLDEKMEVKVVA